MIGRTQTFISPMPIYLPTTPFNQTLSVITSNKTIHPITPTIYSYPTISPSPTRTSTSQPTDTFTPKPSNTSTITPTNTNVPAIVSTPLTPTSTPIPTLLPSGRLEITYPEKIIVDEGYLLTVEIYTDEELSELDIHQKYVSGVISNDTNLPDNKSGRIEEKINLYPIMSVDIINNNPDFEINSDNKDKSRSLFNNKSVVWTWQIRAFKPGENKITINIYREHNVNGKNTVDLVRSKTLIIFVQNKPFFKLVFDIFKDNWQAILGTSGPIGLLILYLGIRDSKKYKDIENRLKRLEEKFSLTKKNKGD